MDIIFLLLWSLSVQSFFVEVQLYDVLNELSGICILFVVFYVVSFGFKPKFAWFSDLTCMTNTDHLAHFH